MMTPHRAFLLVAGLSVPASIHPVAAQDLAPPDTVALTLAAVVQRGLSQTPAVALADLGVRQAAERQRQKRGELLPTLSAGASWANQTENLKAFGFDFPSIPGVAPLPDLIGPFTVLDGRARVSQTVFGYPDWLRVSSAAADRHAAESSRDATADQAALSAAMAYLDVLRSRATGAAREEDVSLAQELASVAEAQLDAEVGTALDVTRARTQLAVARGALITAQAGSRHADIQLARALGLAPGSRFAPADSLGSGLGVSTAPMDRESAMQVALEHRPELALQRERAQSARLERAALSAERLPRLELAADWGYVGRGVPDAIATRRVAVEVTIPIFNGFGREARIAEQEAAEQAAEVRVRDVEQQVLAEVEGALLDVQSAQDHEGVAREQLRLAQDELEQARERFAEGVAGNTDVIQAQASLVEARDAVIGAQFQAAAARVRLARAAGVMDTVR